MTHSRIEAVVFLSLFCTHSSFAGSHARGGANGRTVSDKMPTLSGIFEVKKEAPMTVRHQRDEDSKIDVAGVVVKLNGDYEITLKNNGKAPQVTTDDDGLASASLAMISILNQTKGRDWNTAQNEKVKDWDDSKEVLLRTLKKTELAYRDKYLLHFTNKLKDLPEWQVVYVQQAIDEMNKESAELEKKLEAAKANKNKKEQAAILSRQADLEEGLEKAKTKLDSLTEKIKNAGGPSDTYQAFIKGGKYAYQTAETVFAAIERLEKMKEAPTYKEVADLVGKPLNRIYNDPPKEEGLEVVMRHGYKTSVAAGEDPIKMVFGTRDLPNDDKLYLKKLWAAQESDFTRPSGDKNSTFDFTHKLTFEKAPGNRPPVRPTGGIDWGPDRERPIPLRDK